MWLGLLGLKKGDVLIVHSSLSSFGLVDGGAEAVIDAIIETVRMEGAVVMPTYSVNRRKVRRSKREAALGVTWKYKITPYNQKRIPYWTGAIPEAFRRRKMP